MKFEYASTQRLRFVKSIEKTFLREVIVPVLYKGDKDKDENDILISDESRLSDFSNMFEEHAAIGEGSKPGTKKFRIYQRDFKTFEKTEKIIEAKSNPNTLPLYIEKCKEIFGVDITSVAKEYLPTIFHYIATNSLPKEKKEIKGSNKCKKFTKQKL